MSTTFFNFFVFFLSFFQVTVLPVFRSRKMHLSAPEYGENSNLEERKKKNKKVEKSC